MSGALLWGNWFALIDRSFQVNCDILPGTTSIHGGGRFRSWHTAMFLPCRSCFGGDRWCKGEQEPERITLQLLGKKPVVGCLALVREEDRERLVAALQEVVPTRVLL